MKILVTGGAGFIGSNFLQRFVPRMPEHAFLNVDALTYAGNPHSLDGVADAPNYTFERIDIADAEAVLAAFRRFRPDLVVHFAPESHVDRSIEAPPTFIRSNIDGTLNLPEAARATWGEGEGILQHVSTDEVYGSLGDEGSFTEETAERPGHDQRYAVDSSKIQRECGWRPAETFDSGLRRTVRWYLDNTKWVDQVRSGAYREWIERNYGGRSAAGGDDR